MGRPARPGFRCPLRASRRRGRLSSRPDHARRRDRRPAPGRGLPGGVPAPPLRRRLRPPPERDGLRPRERRPRARLGAHRAARALRRANLRVVADARPALVGARRGEERRRAPAKRRLPRGDARGVRGARAGDRAGAPPPAHGRAPARARLGRARALRGEGAAAPARRLNGAGTYGANAGTDSQAFAAFTTCSSQNSSIPHRPFSRPSPLHLTPPKGTLALMLMCWLTQAVPHSRRAAISSPRATSALHTEPPSP